MRQAEKNALLQMAGSICLLAGVFAKPLHIPESWDFTPFIGALVCYYFFYRGQKKLKQEKLEQPPVAVPLERRKMVFWMVALSLIFGSIGILPLLPYTMENYFPGIYYYVIPFQIVMLAAILPLFWKKIVGPADSSASAPPSS